MRASAKINLFLHVGKAHSDGYHDLFSLVAFTGAGDDLLFCPAKAEADQISLAIGGAFASLLSEEDVNDNLIVRAGRLLQDWALMQNLPVHGADITLTKNLPVAAGIGGGSADAACALKGLADLWDYEPGAEDVQKMCLKLGADVPVCYASQSSWMGGIGEEVSAGPALPGGAIVLVNPRLPLSTGPVFKAFDAAGGQDAPLRPAALPQQFADRQAFIAFLNEQRNDLETAAIKLCPQIGEVLSALSDQQALLARMSGSGPTCFGLFPSLEVAQSVERQLNETYPSWWAVATNLIS